MSQEGVWRTLRVQVCDVNKPLLSVSKLAEAGHRVVFYEEQSYIQDRRTGEKMALHKKDGVYVLRLWVLDDCARESMGLSQVPEQSAQDFTWQGH